VIQNMVKSVSHFPTEHLQTINCYCSSILGLLWVVLNVLLFFFLTYAINTHLASYFVIINDFYLVNLIYSWYENINYC
jgi:hypothetical protein